MTNAGTAPRLLIVEGEDDKRIVPYLMEKNGVRWPHDAPPVIIHAKGGFDDIVTPGFLSAELKAGHQVMGIVADANESPQSRWQSILGQVGTLAPKLPRVFPDTGLIESDVGGVRFGVWLMPDNRSHGMMETFLTFLVPNPNGPVRKYAETACLRAKKLGAPYKKAHRPKAIIHTWLAWQNEPGYQLHEAVNYKVLDPHSPHAAPFVRWFKVLFDL